ncbi:phage integrase central domain-containing protein [Bosea sp. NPDC055332]
MLIEAKEKAGKAERTISKVRWLLSLARPDLGKRPIGEITSIEILAVLRKLENKEHLVTAKRLRSTIGEVSCSMDELDGTSKHEQELSFLHPALWTGWISGCPSRQSAPFAA